MSETRADYSMDWKQVEALARAEGRVTLLRLADELRSLAERTDAAGLPEGQSLRDDAAILSRVAGDLGNAVMFAETTPYDGPLTTVIVGEASPEPEGGTAMTEPCPTCGVTDAPGSGHTHGDAEVGTSRPPAAPADTRRRRTGRVGAAE